MKYLGIDFGTRQLGLATSDETGLIAGKYGTIKREGVKIDVKKLCEVIKQERIQKIVIGYPINMDGTFGEIVRQVDVFVSSLQEEVDLPIEKWDERLSSVSAERLLIQGDVSRRKRRKVIDQVAAVIILQNYLDYQAHFTR